MLLMVMRMVRNTDHLKEAKSDYDANVDDVISYLNSEDGGGYEIGPATDNHNRTYSISSE